jgi:hypothetical protein
VVFSEYMNFTIIIEFTPLFYKGGSVKSEIC